MAYSTSAQVAAEFKDVTFSGSTAITSTDVDRFIEEADAAIDAVLGVKYATPITGATALIIVRTISIQLVAVRIKSILRVKTGDKNVEQESTGLSFAQLAVKHPMLIAIRKGEVNLPDATLASSADGVRSFAVDDGQEFDFQRAIEQW